MPVLLSPEGQEAAVADADVPAYLARRFTPVGADEHAARVGDEQRAAGTYATDAFANNAASAATFGGSDLAQRLIGGDESARFLQRTDEAHPVAAFAGQVAGSLTPGGGVSKLAHAVEGVGEKTALGGVIRGGIEGGVMGFGQGVHELSISDDPLTVERASSVLSSNFLLGAALGGGMSGVGGAVEKGLGRAKGILDNSVGGAAAADAIPEDLAKLDRKGLTAAEQTERDAIETARGPERQSLADDIAAHRAETAKGSPHLATEGVPEIEALGDKVEKVGQRLDNILDNPKALAAKPESALDALQREEHALQQIKAQEAKLRPMGEAELATERLSNPTGSAADGAPGPTSARLTALDSVDGALERNRDLQTRIKGLASEPASARLDAIQAAKEALSAPAREQSLPEKLLTGSLFGTVAGAVGHIPVIGQIPGLAHIAGAKAGEAIGDLVFGRLGKATAAAAKRSSSAVSTLLDVGSKVAPSVRRASIPIASKVLSSVRYAPEKSPAPPAGSSQLADHFLARSAELRSQVAMNPQTGALEMRPDKRAELASRLSPIAARAPQIADQLETSAARRVEFLASKLPKRPDLPMVPGGKDMWRPSDLEMRTFARYAHAVEDPGGVEERLAHGTITPEDTEAYQACYPERYAAMQSEIASRLPQLQKALPYNRRLALSIFSGQPVDPAMTPEILAVLQGSFANDAGGDKDGMSPSVANPAFGSVSKSVPSPTPAQSRSQ